MIQILLGWDFENDTKIRSFFNDFNASNAFNRNLDDAKELSSPFKSKLETRWKVSLIKLDHQVLNIGAKL